MNNLRGVAAKRFARMRAGECWRHHPISPNPFFSLCTSASTCKRDAKRALPNRNRFPQLGGTLGFLCMLLKRAGGHIWLSPCWAPGGRSGSLGGSSGPRGPWAPPGSLGLKGPFGPVPGPLPPPRRGLNLCSYVSEVLSFVCYLAWR